MAIENLEAVEKSLGLEAGKLSEMITSEENHKIDLESRISFSKEDYDARINNIKKETKFNSVEEAIKLARRDNELDFTGKTMENLLEAYGKKVESQSKIEPEKRYSDLNDNFKKLQEVNQGLESKYTTLESDVKKRSQNRQINETLLKDIPDNTTIDKDDILAIMKAKYDFNIGEDGFEIIDNGKVLKNETSMNNLTPTEFLKTFIKPYIKEVEGGKGGKDTRGNAKEGTFDAWDIQMKEQGISGQEYTLRMQKAFSEGTLKM